MNKLMYKFNIRVELVYLKSKLIYNNYYSILKFTGTSKILTGMFIHRSVCITFN